MPGKQLLEIKSNQKIIDFIEQNKWNIDVEYEKGLIPFRKYFEKGDKRSEQRGWVNRTTITINENHKIWSDIICYSAKNKVANYRLNVGVFTGNDEYDEVNIWHNRCVTQDAKEQCFALNEWAHLLNDIKILLNDLKHFLKEEAPNYNYNEVKNEK